MPHFAKGDKFCRLEGLQVALEGLQEGLQVALEGLQEGLQVASLETFQK